MKWALESSGVMRVRLLCVVVLMVCAQADVDSLRWWRSRALVNALALTATQSAAIDGFYEDTLPARRRASEETAAVRNRVADALRAGDYDDDVLRLTARLAEVDAQAGHVRRQMLRLAVAALTPVQRDKLTRLIASKRVVE
jgi:LTXXQ motif family protein